jgi:hypothetical protein
MATVSWTLTRPGREITVSAGTLTMRGGALRPTAESDDCTLFSHTSEDASVTAIRQWIGVAPTKAESGEPSITHYDYQQIGSAHVAMPRDAAAYKIVETQGRTWHAVLIRTRHSASVQFEHDLSPAQLSP